MKSLWPSAEVGQGRADLLLPVIQMRPESRMAQPNPPTAWCI